MLFRRRMTPVVKTIIVVNFAVYMLQVLTSNLISNNFLEHNFSLHYISLLYEYKFWQLFTYMFLHGGFWHILFNMLALFFIGCEIEREWGARHFLRYYLATGVGAGIFVFMVDFLYVFIVPDGINNLGYTLGASGAIFGLLLAYSLLYGDRRITLLLFFIIPINVKAKNLLVICLGFSFLLSLFFGSDVKISNSGHIGGVVFGFLYFLIYRNNETYFYCVYSIKQGWENLKSALFSSNVKTVKNKPFSSRFNRGAFKFQDKIDETKMSESEIESKIDDLLDKISLLGIKGLTEGEKSFLQRVSHLYRHKFPK